MAFFGDLTYLERERERLLDLDLERLRDLRRADLK